MKEELLKTNEAFKPITENSDKDRVLKFKTKIEDFLAKLESMDDYGVQNAIAELNIESDNIENRKIFLQLYMSSFYSNDMVNRIVNEIMDSREIHNCLGDMKSNEDDWISFLENIIMDGGISDNQKREVVGWFEGDNGLYVKTLERVVKKILTKVEFDNNNFADNYLKIKGVVSILEVLETDWAYNDDLDYGLSDFDLNIVLNNFIQDENINYLTYIEVQSIIKSREDNRGDRIVKEQSLPFQLSKDLFAVKKDDGIFVSSEDDR